MHSNEGRRFIILFLFIALVQAGCASFGPVLFGSAFGVAGQQGIGYFSSGSTRRVFYSRMDRSVYSVEKSFYNLSITMKKKERCSDGRIHFTGEVGIPESSDVEVTLRAISENVTEVVVVSRKGIFPDRAICHTLMEKIAHNMNDESQTQSFREVADAR